MLITLFCVKRLHPTQSYRTNPLFPYRTPFLSLSVAADVPLLIEPELCLDRLAQFHRARIGIARQRIGRTLRRGEGRARLLTCAERIFVRTQCDPRAPVGAGRLAGNIGSDAPDPRLGWLGRAHVCTPVSNAHFLCRLLRAPKSKRIITIPTPSRNTP